MATETISWQTWREMESHAPFGTYSKRCNVMHQVLRSPVSDEDTLRKREKFAKTFNLMARSASIFADPLNSASFIEAYILVYEFEKFITIVLDVIMGQFKSRLHL